MTEPNGPLPVVAIVGRPNVGKSTLVNRILGRRAAVVQDIPGVTRDRISYEALWNGKRFTVVDTGGWDPKAIGLGASITRQAQYAMETADVIVLVVDSPVGATDTDLAAARILRRSDRPVILVANKVDDERSEADAAELWSLGLGEPQAVSALHGRSSGDLLDLILDAMPEAPREQLEEGGPRRVALVGRPNVGKSSLLNRLAKDERSVVDSVAGTTVDPVDSIVTLGGEEWRFVDTAGLRRKVNTASGTEYYASLRTEAAIQAAEVAVVLLAADEVISEQDQRVITQVVEAGRALVIAINKWDTLDEDRHCQLEKEIERELARVRWATPGQHLRRHRPRGQQARRPPARGAGLVGVAGADGGAEHLRARAGAGDAAAGPRRPGAEDQVRHAGRRPAAAVRGLLHRLPRGRLPAVPRAQDPRAVGLRGHADRGVGQGPRGPGERPGQGLTTGRGRPCGAVTCSGGRRAARGSRRRTARGL